MAEKVLVVSAHPDDETLGVGGTLLRHAEKGDEIYWLIATGISTGQGFTPERVKSRSEEIKAVSAEYGFRETHELNFPTIGLSDHLLIELIPAISRIFNSIRPETVYCPNRSDAHSDHRILFDAVAACTKSFRYPFIRKFLMYECLSETEFAPPLHEKAFLPNYFVDISAHLEKKLAIMQIFASEMGEHPFPRSVDSIRALAVLRGAMCGSYHAEAFQLLKYIDR